MAAEFSAEAYGMPLDDPVRVSRGVGRTSSEMEREIWVFIFNSLLGRAAVGKRYLCQKTGNVKEMSNSI